MTIKKIKAVELDNVEKWMWKYLLERGSILIEASYYGATTDIVKAKQCKELIKRVGIDWKQTTGVKDNNDSRFNGTFAEDTLYVKFLRGTLVLNNGTKWEWYYEYDEPFNILDLIGEALPEPKSYA